MGTLGPENLIKSRFGGHLVFSIEVLRAFYKAEQNDIHFRERYNDPANMYLFEVNSRNTGKVYEICSVLTVET